MHYRGNLAADFLIPKVEDLNCHWIEFARQVFDPGKNKMIKEKRISCFTKKDWDLMMQQSTGKGVPGGSEINFCHAAGWHSWEHLHDPTLPSNDPEKLKIKKP